MLPAFNSSCEFVEDSNFESLLSEQCILLDVRSELEYSEGNFPGSVNHPILVNSERTLVGTTYKKEGKTAAIELGHRLVFGDVKSSRVQTWEEILSSGKTPVLYCARGGLRSEITQKWLAEAGLKVPRVKGGYKSLRRYLLTLNSTLPDKFNFKVISGKTGSGKTKFLARLKQSRSVIDLEDLAKHRGSAFGNVYGGQPSQANFENFLAAELLVLNRAQDRTLFVEAESRRIGRCFIPIDFWRSMNDSDILVLEVPIEKRINNILEDYVSFVFQSFQLSSPTDAVEKFGNYLLTSLRNIAKHLGSERFNKLTILVNTAIDYQKETSEISKHRFWIEPLLVEYYDPHYEKHIKSYGSRILLKEGFEELWEALN